MLNWWRIPKEWSGKNRAVCYQPANDCRCCRRMDGFKLIVGGLAVTVSRLIYKTLLKGIAYESIMYADFCLVDKLHRRSRGDYGR